jgi:hypothetical protein
MVELGAFKLWANWIQLVPPHHGRLVHGARFRRCDDAVALARREEAVDEEHVRRGVQLP